MNKFKMVFISLALIFAALTIGYNLEKTATAATEPNQPKSPAEANLSDKSTDDPGQSELAATVNGIKITEAEIQEKIQPQLAKMASRMPPAFIEQYKKKMRQQVLNWMIETALLDQAVKEAGIEVTDQQVLDKIEEIAAEQEVLMSLEDLKKFLQETGQDFNEIGERIQQEMAYEKLIEKKFPGQTDINDKDANEYYKEHRAQFEIPEKVRASHILIKVEDDPNSDPNKAKALAKTKVQGLLKKIKEENADFAELAKEHSACPSSEGGGDLGLQPRQAWVAAFSDAAFALDVNEVSDIVETQHGYHIIKATQREQAGTTSFKEAENQIIQMLEQQKKMALLGDTVKDLRAKANIIYPPGKEPEPAPAVPQKASPVR